MDPAQWPSFSAVGALVAVIGYLLYSNWRDRAQQQVVIRQAFARIAALERKVTDLETALDHEREQRHRAEDGAATARRDAADVRSRLDRLTGSTSDG